MLGLLTTFARRLDGRSGISIAMALIVATALGPSTAFAAKPAGTVKQEWVVSRDEVGSGANSACFNLDAGNWAGRYRKFQVQEGWIYYVKSPNSYTGTVAYYRWNSHGQIAPYDVVRSYVRYECDPS